MGGHTASETNVPVPELALDQMAGTQADPGPGWRIKSTACLVGSNAAYIELALQRLPAGQPHMQKNNPVSSHSEVQTGLVLARCGFGGVLKHGSHARVRHVRFQRDVSSGSWFAFAVDQLQTDSNWPDLRRVRRDGVLHRYPGRDIART